jgi:serine/threonine protein kinase
MADSNHFRRVEDLFQRARVLPAEARTRFLLQEAFGNIALMKEVEDLLRRADAPPAGLADDRLSADARARYMSALGVAGAAAGTRFGPFEVIDQIGEGGMGTVYRARQDVPNRIVALKVVHPRSRSADSIRRFHVEADALGRLQHPNVAQIFMAGAEDHGFGPQPYLAMEFIDGLPLLEHVRAHNLDLGPRLELLAKVARAVGQAHRAGLVHRDIKPANIMVTRAGEPKVLDFGIARIVAEDASTTTAHTRAGQLLGTLAYMSPEQLTGSVDEVGPASDIYALGIVLFELVEGCTPHDLEDKPIAESIRLLTESPVPAVTTIAPPFDRRMNAIIARATHRNPSKRYESAEALADDVTRFIGAPPPSTWSRNRPAARRRSRKPLWLIGSGVAATLVVALSLMLLLQDDDDDPVNNGDAPPLPQPQPGPGDEQSAAPSISGAPIEMLDRAYEHWMQGTLAREIATMEEEPINDLSEFDARSKELAVALAAGVGAWFDPNQFAARAESRLNDWLSDDDELTESVAAARLTLGWIFLKRNQPQPAGLIFETIVRAGDSPGRPRVQAELLAEARVGRAATLAGPRMMNQSQRVVNLCELGLSVLVDRPGPAHWRARRALETGSAALEAVGETDRAAKWRAYLRE